MTTDTRDSRRWLCRAFLAASLATASSLRGQASFDWPVSTGDVSRYVMVEECIAAAERVDDSVSTWGPRGNTAAVTQPASGVETARRCTSRFPSRTVGLHDFALLFELYLHAAQDADAQTLLTRRLAAIGGAAGLRERAEVLDTAIRTYLTVQPERLAAAESLLVEGSRLPAPAFTLAHRITGYGNLMDLSRRAADSARAHRAAERLVAIGASLTPVERQDEWYTSRGKARVYWALDYLSAGDLLDSLRRSTAAYVALKRANWKTAGGGMGVIPFSIGDKARPLEGAFWFGRGDSAASRTSGPTPGKVSLVAFLQHGCGPGCDGAVNAVLRRVLARFPDVELTAVVKTLGHMGDTTPLTPEAEAALLRTQLRDRVPGVLLVESTPYARLAAPDKRRINSPTPNEINYWIGSRIITGNRIAYLVDPTGTIVDAFYLNSFFPSRERELAALLEILGKR